MTFTKKYDNGLRLVVRKIDGLMSVSTGILVNIGSRNESKEENGISHFIEHVTFKGTSKRSAFEISDHIDCLGAQINAFTSKEITCYYTKSTAEHVEECSEILSDIFFNSVYDEKELEKEKGVVIEEINMSEDSPEDLCLDLIAESYFGNDGLGQTILGPEENIRRFTRDDVIAYMKKYYTSDNVVISFAGNIDFSSAEKIVEKYFLPNFKGRDSAPQKVQGETFNKSLIKKKQIEQAHIAICFPCFKSLDKRTDALNIANAIIGGGMSSRLFQKIREELGLCYSIYSYPSLYKDCGVMEIYAGVNSALRDEAFNEIINVLKTVKEKGVTEKEFARGKEQIKSSLIMGQESTASQMLLYGKYLMYSGKKFDFEEKIRRIDALTLKDVNDVIKEVFDFDKMAVASVGTSDKVIKKQ